MDEAASSFDQVLHDARLLQLRTLQLRHTFEQLADKLDELRVLMAAAEAEAKPADADSRREPLHVR